MTQSNFLLLKGIVDNPDRLAADIQRKACGEAPAALVEIVARGSAPLIEWLTYRHALPFELIDNFNYPGHSAFRMHGLPTRTGRELIDRLRNAAELSEIVVLTGCIAETLFAEKDGRVRGLEIVRRDGKRECIGCDAAILGCSGYGGNPDLVRHFIPEMADALYFGHPGNRGDAVLWGEPLAAELACLGAYQGHGSVATPHNILITWAVIMEGGFQVNTRGRRFCDETCGYSEQAAEVLRQPGAMAWDIFDARIAAVARQFEDFRDAESAGAILVADSVGALAAKMRVPADIFAEEWRGVELLKTHDEVDQYGRRFSAKQKLMPPYFAVKVTGALFHTQGGLVIDTMGRVKRKTVACSRTFLPPAGPRSEFQAAQRLVTCPATVFSLRPFWAALPARAQRRWSRKTAVTDRVIEQRSSCCPVVGAALAPTDMSQPCDCKILFDVNQI